MFWFNKDTKNWKTNLCFCRLPIIKFAYGSVPPVKGRYVSPLHFPGRGFTWGLITLPWHHGSDSKDNRDWVRQQTKIHIITFVSFLFITRYRREAAHANILYSETRHHKKCSSPKVAQLIKKKNTRKMFQFRKYNTRINVSNITIIIIILAVLG